MKLSLFNENDRVLLLGEGNFSFSSELRKHNLRIEITSTCYELSPINDTALENIEILKNNGVLVLLGVDATNLQNHLGLNNKQFDKIVFNFPHVCSKMRLDKNRDLLKGFFISAVDFLTPNGQILLSLCNGQGGTLHDNPRRRWNDSWKAKEMAAHGDFILKSVEPFFHDLFESYSTTGFRGMDKEFHKDQALTHVFVKITSPQPIDFIPHRIIDSKNLSSDISSENSIDSFFSQSKVDTLCPPVFSFDFTFIVTEEFDESLFLLNLYNKAGRIVKNTMFIRSYKFPDDSRISKTFRINYQSDDVPLYRKRVIEIHHTIIPQIINDYFNECSTR